MGNNVAPKFESLVENAFCFLLKAIDEFEDSPKYSAISFCAGIELVLKARLMKEHWTLIVANKEEPDWKDFCAGEFRSVTLKAACNRLQKIILSPVPKSDIEIFMEFTKHRNRMVHFYNDDLKAEALLNAQQSIVKLQLQSWRALYGLLTGQWEEVFRPWAGVIKRIETALREHTEYLRIVFVQRKGEISAKNKEGYLVQLCPTCSFKADIHSSDLEVPYESTCLVCNSSDTCIRAKCDSCGEVILFRNDGFQTCSKCQSKITSDDLARILIDEGAAHIAAMDGDTSWDLGNCAECNGYQSIVRTKYDKFLCTHCFYYTDELSVCEWCNEPNTGDMEFSYGAGCSVCDGKMGWES